MGGSDGKKCTSPKSRQWRQSKDQDSVNQDQQQQSAIFCLPMCRTENKKKEKKLVVKKHNDRLPEKQKCSFKLATHSLLSVIIINN